MPTAKTSCADPRLHRMFYSFFLYLFIHFTDCRRERYPRESFLFSLQPFFFLHLLEPLTVELHLERILASASFARCIYLSISSIGRCRPGFRATQNSFPGPGAFHVFPERTASIDSFHFWRPCLISFPTVKFSFPVFEVHVCFDDTILRFLIHMLFGFISFVTRIPLFSFYTVLFADPDLMLGRRNRVVHRTNTTPISDRPTTLVIPLLFSQYLPTKLSP